jgi:hypothetical protein
MTLVDHGQDLLPAPGGMPAAHFEKRLDDLGLRGVR